MENKCKCGGEIKAMYQDPATNVWGYGGWFAYCTECGAFDEQTRTTEEWALVLNGLGE